MSIEPGSQLLNWCTDVSNDERWILLYEQHPETGRDWFAYVSNRSGRDEVYVRRFEPRDTRDHLVSTGGGREPVWNPDGSELLYRVGNALMAVPVKLGATIELSEPVLLFEANFEVESGGLNQYYDVHPDGRIVYVRRTIDVSRIRVALGWARDLKKAAAR